MDDLTNKLNDTFLRSINKQYLSELLEKIKTAMLYEHDIDVANAVKKLTECIELDNMPIAAQTVRGIAKWLKRNLGLDIILDGEVCTWHDDGSIDYDATYSDGRLCSGETWYRKDDGRMYHSKHYSRNGVLIVENWYAEDGTIESQEITTTTKVETWYNSGEPTLEVTWINGYRHGTQYAIKDGVKIPYAQWDEGKLIWTNPDKA